MFIDIGHFGCFTALPPQRPLTAVGIWVVSWHFLGISTFFSIAPPPPLPPSYLVFSLSILFHPSIISPIHPPTHSSIHPHIHTPFVHPPTLPFIHERMGGWKKRWVNEWVDEWMCGWVDGRMFDVVGWLDAWVRECVCWLIVSSSLGLREIKPRQRPHCL